MRLALGGGHSISSAVLPGVSGGVGGSISGAGGGSPVSTPSGTSSDSVYIVSQLNPL